MPPSSLTIAFFPSKKEINMGYWVAPLAEYLDLPYDVLSLAVYLYPPLMVSTLDGMLTKWEAIKAASLPFAGSLSPFTGTLIHLIAQYECRFSTTGGNH